MPVSRFCLFGHAVGAFPTMPPRTVTEKVHGHCLPAGVRCIKNLRAPGRPCAPDLERQGACAETSRRSKVPVLPWRSRAPGTRLGGPEHRGWAAGAAPRSPRPGEVLMVLRGAGHTGGSAVCRALALPPVCRALAASRRSSYGAPGRPAPRQGGSGRAPFPCTVPYLLPPILLLLAPPECTPFPPCRWAVQSFF
jgi:hypothetical protein